mmetsp:Transcript_100120/g.278969  ORF Transcript_100120/g.278969 Transcript_100120/m.278969 type:complete len:241 (+) Transcript_100120:217-939(+)
MAVQDAFQLPLQGGRAVPQCPFQILLRSLGQRAVLGVGGGATLFATEHPSVQLVEPCMGRIQCFLQVLGVLHLLVLEGLQLPGLARKMIVQRLRVFALQVVHACLQCRQLPLKDCGLLRQLLLASLGLLRNHAAELTVPFVDQATELPVPPLDLIRKRREVTPDSVQVRNTFAQGCIETLLHLLRAIGQKLLQFLLRALNQSLASALRGLAMLLTIRHAFMHVVKLRPGSPQGLRCLLRR